MKNEEFLNDLDFIQLSLTQKMFESNIEALINQHTGAENLSYFVENWYERNSDWYEGFQPMCPSTNNALESYNALIKRKYTLRERLPMSKFFDTMKKLIGEQSLLRSQFSEKCKTFSEEKEFSLKFWTEALHFQKEKYMSSLRVYFKILFLILILSGFFTIYI